jgi:DNA modification methylase
VEKGLPKHQPSDTQRPSLSYIRPDALVPDPRNPRVHSREQIQAIARSIRTSRFTAPILVDKNNRVVAGHGRLEAAKLLGLPEVPVVRLEHLTDEQAKAYMLADNKLTDRSSWDDSRVAAILKELSSIALIFEIEATGFEMPEVDLRIQSLGPSEQAESEDEAEHGEAPTVSRQGDLWLLDDHRLLCGSALDGQAYETLLGEERAAAIFTDPPYNVKINGHVAGKGKNRHREFPMASGEMSPAQFTEFLGQSFGLMMQYSADHAVAFGCMDWRHMSEMLGAIQAVDCELLNLCVWSKTNAGMGSLYRSAHELVFVFGKRGAQRRNNVQLGKYGRYRTNVWTYPGMSSFGRRNQKRTLDLHPTVKPVAMVSDAILDVTERGGIVLDPFCGSGTTIVAAERTGRRGYGIELDPAYVDTAVRRWQKMTKKAAMHACGKTFDEIAAERSAPDVEA